MEILIVTAKEYSEIFSKHTHIYNSAAFSQLNANKCEQIHYLVFKDSKARLGIILGEQSDLICSPFSAPFGGFEFTTEPKIEYLEEALTLLIKYAQSLNKKLKLTTPPPIYGTSINAKIINALMRMGVMPQYIDLNYHYDISRFKQYETYISRNARKNLHNAQNQGFEFTQLNSNNDEDIARAYSVIKANREGRGYPLRMTLNDVINTSKIIPADFFVVSKNDIDIAAGQVFHVTDSIAQVVYWGDKPGFSEMRPMNYLSYKIFEHYNDCGTSILDIGPSTENGIPNYGLCEFKENLGCEISLKHTFLI